MRKTISLLFLFLMILAACSPVTGPSLQETAPASTDVVPTTVPPTPSPVPPTGTPEPTQTPRPTATATPLPEDYGPDNFPDDVNPLTGLLVSDPSLLDRSPLAVKIQTFPRGQRPDWGVSQADIVFDYYQNNGMTRLYAVFYGEDAEKVGPIRSGRLLDVILTRVYKTIFAFGGADRQIMSRLYSSDVGDRLVLEGNSSPLYREDPNNFNFLLVGTEKLTEFAQNEDLNSGRQDLSGMSFQYEPPVNGQAGKQVFVRYSISAYSRWDYDPDTGRYLLFKDTQEDENGLGEDYAPFTDRGNNEQVSASNVVVLLVPHSYFYRSGNSEIIEIQLAGSGPAYAFRDGQAYTGLKWNITADSVLHLTDEVTGEPFPYKQGKSWYQVVGQSSEVDESKKDSGIWRFVSSIP